MTKFDTDSAAQLAYEAGSLASMIRIIADYGMTEGKAAGQMADALLGVSTLADSLCNRLHSLADPAERRRQERQA